MTDGEFWLLEYAVDHGYPSTRWLTDWKVRENALIARDIEGRKRVISTSTPFSIVEKSRSELPEKITDRLRQHEKEAEESGDIVYA